MTAAAPSAHVSPRRRGARRLFAGAALGLLLPIGLVLVWEAAVRLRWSDGRLVPPPSRIGATLIALAYTGELARHCVRDAAAGRCGLRARRARRHARRRRDRGFATRPRSAGPDPAGAARHSVHCLGAAVRTVAGNFRDLEDRADRGRRVLSRLPRGCWARSCRSTARSSRSAWCFDCRDPRWRGAFCCRPCCRPMWCRCARGSGSAGCLWLGPRSWGRRRARVCLGRRPATRQAGANHRRHSQLCGARQIERCRACHGDRAVAALGRRVRRQTMSCSCSGSIMSARSIPIASMRLTSCR
jgi:hypothetical protein